MSQRKHYSSQDKVKILREHFEQNLTVPEICEKYRIHPNQFYQWKKIFFEKAGEVFSAKPHARADNKKIEHLQNRLNDRNAVIAELLPCFDSRRIKKNRQMPIKLIATAISVDRRVLLQN